MISALAWLPRGVAKAIPEVAQPTGAPPPRSVQPGARREVDVA
jgi:hypothetical protein